MAKTIPLKGGWVMVIRPLPTRIQVPLLSIFYAMPVQAFPEHYFTTASWGQHPSKYHDMLYRRGQRAKLSEDEEYALDSWLRDQRAYWEESDDWVPDIELKVRIHTPDGEVQLIPPEYTVINDINPYLDMLGAEDIQMHELGGLEKAAKLNEQLFYCMSRGISRIEAYQMLLGTIDRPNVFWLEMHPAYAQHFGLAA